MYEEGAGRRLEGDICRMVESESKEDISKPLYTIPQ
jgi:hypothetical protein